MVAVIQVLAFVAELAVIGVWLWQHVEMRRIRRDGLKVPVSIAPKNRDAPPPVTVIIPARNEAGRIRECLSSVLSQNPSSPPVIVVDDRSEDNTAQVVQAAGAGMGHVTLHRIDDLPAGWLGKSHALWSAAALARTDWLLFLDADCRLLPDGLSSALRYAIKRDVDLLSLWPRDGSTGFWERLLIPLCGAMIVIWYGSRRVNAPRSPIPNPQSAVPDPQSPISNPRSAIRIPLLPDAFANGQFILVRRDAYFAMGGHAAVKDAIIEDVPLARRAKATGLSILSALGPDIYAVRMYGSLADVVRGWQRIYVGVLTKLQIALCMLSIVIGSLWPFVLVGLTIGPVLRGAGGWPVIWFWTGLVHLAALAATSLRFFSLARCRLRYLLLYPLSCLGVLMILGTALFKGIGRRKVTWRDTDYEIESSTIQP